MSDKTYNGWTNYETWVCALWLDNDQGTQEYVRELTQDAKSVNDLAGTLKDMIEEQKPLASEANLFSDLMSAAISEINFYEMAENYWQDYREPEITAIDLFADDDETDENNPASIPDPFIMAGIDETYERLSAVDSAIAADFQYRWIRTAYYVD